MKKVYIQTRLVSSGGHCYELLNINGGFVAGGLLEYSTIGEAYDAALTHVQHFPESFTLISPAMVADLLSTTVHHLHTLKTYSDASLITPPNRGLEDLIQRIEKLLNA